MNPVAKVVSGYSGDPDTRGDKALRFIDQSLVKIGDTLYSYDEIVRLQNESHRLQRLLDDALSCLESAGGKADLAASIIRSMRDESLDGIPQSFEVIMEYSKEQVERLKKETAQWKY